MPITYINDVGYSRGLCSPSFSRVGGLYLCFRRSIQNIWHEGIMGPGRCNRDDYDGKDGRAPGLGDGR